MSSVEPGEPSEPDPEETSEPEPATDRSSRKRSYRAKRGSDSLAPIALLAALACAGVLGRQAYLDRLTTELSLSIGLTIVALALVVFAMRVANSSRSVRLSAEGRLRLIVGETRHDVDLADPETEVTMTGEPGAREWRIRIVGKDASPVTVDAETVDPRSFTTALRQWRPDL